MPRKIVENRQATQSARKNSDFDRIKENVQTEGDSCAARMCRPRRSFCWNVEMSPFTEAVGVTAYAMGSVSIVMYFAASTIVQAGVSRPTLVSIQNSIGLGSLFGLAAFLGLVAIDASRASA